MADCTLMANLGFARLVAAPDQYGSSTGAQFGGAVTLKDTLEAGSGWSTVSPSDINDSGQIVGATTTPEGLRHAFLMNPLPPIPATSPGLLAVLAVGISVAGYVLLSRRRADGVKAGSARGVYG